MSTPEQRVLDAIAELEAIEEPDEIHELVRWQLEQGNGQGDHVSFEGLPQSVARVSVTLQVQAISKDLEIAFAALAEQVRKRSAGGSTP